MLQYMGLEIKKDWFLSKGQVSPVPQKINLLVENSRPQNTCFYAGKTWTLLAKGSVAFTGWAKRGLLWNHKWESFRLWEMRVWAAELTLPAAQELWERKLLRSKSPEEVKHGGENYRERARRDECLKPEKSDCTMGRWYSESRLEKWRAKTQNKN